MNSSAIERKSSVEKFARKKKINTAKERFMVM